MYINVYLYVFLSFFYQSYHTFAFDHLISCFKFKLLNLIVFTQDIALASVSMRTVPFGPLAQKLTFSKANYGSIPRFYIKTDEDFVIPLALQEHMIQSNPPRRTFQLKGSDHSPFFSKPQALQKILLEVSDLPLV